MKTQNLNNNFTKILLPIITVVASGGFGALASGTLGMSFALYGAVIGGVIGYIFAKATGSNVDLSIIIGEMVGAIVGTTYASYQNSKHGNDDDVDIAKGLKCFMEAIKGNSTNIIGSIHSDPMSIMNLDKGFDIAESCVMGDNLSGDSVIL